MIDWFNLVANALWILACAIALATLSHASWMASLQHEKLRKIMALPVYQTIINIAGIFFCLGLAGTSSKWWEIILWLIIAALITGQLAGKIINHKK
jgi:hypothetical protein